MQALSRPPLAVRGAQGLSRIVTWGVRADLRRELLLESDEDWELMYDDQGALRLLMRVLRGIPAAIWIRMEDRELTALPAAIVLLLLGLLGIGAGSLAQMYPIDIRRYVFLSALGLGMLGIAMARSPRIIPLRRLRLPTLVVFAGFLGMATNMPSAADWNYTSPMVGSAAGDALIATGFVVIALGCLVIGLGTFTNSAKALFPAGGLTIVAGTFLFGVGQIVWGVVAVTVEPAVTATSVPLGLGAFSVAHVTPRLRHLVTD